MVLLGQSETQSDAASGQYAVGVEVRELVCDFSCAKVGHRTEPPEQLPPVLDLPHDHAPILVLPDGVAPDVFGVAEQTQVVKRNVTRRRAHRAAISNDILAPDFVVSLVSNLVGLILPLATERGSEEVHANIEERAAEWIELVVPRIALDAQTESRRLQDNLRLGCTKNGN